ncbi:hypothetical protein SteCoe_2947 [Stentor coeruleus]|uniref:Uncharacterized protein n=1 Tax=Stentor coeruleus TaxID=5963 RepID=A0A1R2CYF8_9CILI|nr:hypothetical protein SteCoe_2947 [Stentor coeruleus]
MVLAEFLIFLILGLTSFLSFIFLPRRVNIYMIGAITYGIILIIGGGLGLYSNYKVIIKLIGISLGLLVAIGLLNILAGGAYCVLFAKNVIKGMPDCDDNCDTDRFWYVAYTGYYLFEIIFSICLAVFSGIAFRHTLIYFNKEKDKL